MRIRPASLAAVGNAARRVHGASSALIGACAIAALCALAASTCGTARAADHADDPLSRLCEYGITLALQGRSAAAESAFVSLLSRSPGDARALNNLGNLHLWRGEPATAYSFYRSAGMADTADAGIQLNAATALTFAGDTEAAGEMAAEAVRRAGGFDAATDLLGLPREVPATEAERGADRTRMSREQVLQMLRSAASAVPADSVGHSPAADSSHSGAGKHGATWRSAGARGSDESGPPAIVYWKH